MDSKVRIIALIEQLQQNIEGLKVRIEELEKGT